jgi:iron uptake system EfeUOB component EfeO/EfeM
MTTTTKLKDSWKVDKENLHNTISLLKKSMSDFKEERKLEWKSFKGKFNDEMENVEKSLKKLTTLHKK